MKNTYLNTLKNLSNKELIEITINSESYESEAVQIANDFILERNIDESEINKVKFELDRISFEKEKRRNQINSLTEQVKVFFKPIFSHSDEISPKKWLNSFIFLVAIQFIWILIELLSSFSSVYDPFDMAYYIMIFTYIITVSYLLLKRKKWGWILLFGEKLLIIFFSIVFFIVFLINDILPEKEVGEFFWAFLISIVFISFLMKKEIYSFFNILDEERAKYIKRISIFSISLVSIAGILIFFLLEGY